MNGRLMWEKKVKGRKRHIVVDTQGHMLHLKVHAANIADAGYQGTSVDHVKSMGLKIEISKRIKDKWTVLPKRWVVERAFAWINNCRRMSKDFEIPTCSAENFMRIAMIQIMLDRLC